LLLRAHAACPRRDQKQNTAKGLRVGSMTAHHADPVTTDYSRDSINSTKVDDYGMGKTFEP
jgi:hypothetical protein